MSVMLVAEPLATPSVAVASTPLKLLSCDDHDLFRAGLRQVLGDLEGEPLVPDVVSTAYGAAGRRLIQADSIPRDPLCARPIRLDHA
jgi:hypothetical protein